MAPSLFPAPTRLWISSINRMILPSAFSISFRTALSLSSNSPRYLAPAISEPMSSSIRSLSFKPRGTSLLKIRQASPSTIAVLPTPGSPIRTGLFLVLRERISITLLISSSRPMTGSILPLRTSSTRLRPYFFSGLRLFSSSLLLIIVAPLSIEYLSSRSFLEKRQYLHNSAHTAELLNSVAINISNMEIYLSLRCLDFLSASRYALYT